MNPIPFPQDDEDFAQLLRELHPAATPLDPAIVFYRMGLEAGSRQLGPIHQKADRTRLLAMVGLLLAFCVSAGVVGPVSYRLGQASTDLQKHSSATRDLTLPTEPMAGEPMIAPQPPRPLASPHDEVAGSIEFVWPWTQTAVVRWLLGDEIPYWSNESNGTSLITQRLIAGRSGADWIDEMPRGIGPRKRESDHQWTPDTSKSQPRLGVLQNNPQQPAPMRASDWKDIVNRNDIY